MEMGELKKKLIELSNNPKVEEELKKANSYDDVLAILRSNGINVSEDEMAALFQEEDTELSENELDLVAGGGAVMNHIFKYWNPAYWIFRAAAKKNFC